MIRFVFLCSLLWSIKPLAAQIAPPEEFLGYRLGEKFTYHHQAVSYLQQLEAQSPMISLERYGESYEGRPLYVAYISNPENIKNLESIRRKNLSLAKSEKNTSGREEEHLLIWMSYNIHGNEAATMEAGLMTIYNLLTDSKWKELLQNTVVIIDPCLNPDGHNRYVQGFTERIGRKPNAKLLSREHSEPWPGGRGNHYFFDLNRDWAWQTQQETRARIALYNQWLPHVHVDFHEMGIDDPYYFAPSAEPVHLAVTGWQREFQEKVGEHIALSFDSIGQDYFKGEIFDLFYPSYGDTYPTFNGAVGMTYEQGGSYRAGLTGINSEGDTITLEKRASNHYLAGLKTIEASWNNKTKLIRHFQEYFNPDLKDNKYENRSYVLRMKDKDQARYMEEYLTLNGISFGYAKAQKVTLRSFKTGKDTQLKLGNTDMVLPSHQMKWRLMNVLFESDTFLPDSNTYDITGWSLPYALGIDAYSGTATVLTESGTFSFDDSPITTENKVTAYAIHWRSPKDARFLSALLQKGFVPIAARKDLSIGAADFKAGTVFITRSNHKHFENWEVGLKELAAQYNQEIFPVPSSYSRKGSSFGSSDFHRINAPVIAALGGQGVSPTNLGEIWHYFDIEIEYPVHIVESSQINERVLEEVNVLILPSVRSSGVMTNDKWKSIQRWVQNGGILIAVEGAVEILSGQDGYLLKPKHKSEKVKEITDITISNYRERERNDISGRSPGAIIEVRLDNSHPLAFGYDSVYYNIKNNSAFYLNVENGWNVGVCKSSPLVSGFVGSELKKEMNNFLFAGVQTYGRGRVVYFVDNPIFRSFWHNGKLMFSNAVFQSY